MEESEVAGVAIQSLVTIRQFAQNGQSTRDNQVDGLSTPCSLL
jgi:hypothetical protein